MSGENPAIDRKRAIVVDGAAVVLRRIAIKHRAGNGSGTCGNGDCAAVTGKVVRAINAVPVKGSAIDGETAGAVNGAAVHRLAVADIHIGQRERSSVVDGAAVALARVPAGERHIADGHAAARRNGEDLDRIAAGNGQGALIDPVAIHQSAVDRDVCRHVQCAKRRIQRQRCAGAERPGPQPVGGVGEGDRLIAAFLIGVYDRFPQTGLVVVRIDRIVQRFHHKRIYQQTAGSTFRIVCCRNTVFQNSELTALAHLIIFCSEGKLTATRCITVTGCRIRNTGKTNRNINRFRVFPFCHAGLICKTGPRIRIALTGIDCHFHTAGSQTFHKIGAECSAIRIDLDSRAEDLGDQPPSGQISAVIKGIVNRIGCIIDHIARSINGCCGG